MNILVKNCAVLLALALLPLAANAGETTAGAYTIRYNALTANFLPKTTTDRLGIESSLHQGVVNVTVLKGSGAAATSVPAQVTGKAATLTGTKVPIRFQRVTDRGGESWIGSFRVPGNDTLRFNLDVAPKGGPATHVQFTHDFVVD